MGIKKFKSFLESSNNSKVDITDFLGKTFTSIEGFESGSSEIVFKTHTNSGYSSDGITYRMYHQQDCCEDVRLDELYGDVNDLLDTPILRAEKKTNSEDTFGKIEHPDSFTWTFYTLATIKGYVDIKWLGESNGYYSEEVDIYKGEGLPYSSYEMHQ